VWVLLSSRAHRCANSKRQVSDCASCAAEAVVKCVGAGGARAPLLPHSANQSRAPCPAGSPLSPSPAYPARRWTRSPAAAARKRSPALSQRDVGVPPPPPPPSPLVSRQPCVRIHLRAVMLCAPSPLLSLHPPHGYSWQRARRTAVPPHADVSSCGLLHGRYGHTHTHTLVSWRAVAAHATLPTPLPSPPPKRFTAPDATRPDVPGVEPVCVDGWER
jgi:hypothetical protein